MFIREPVPDPRLPNRPTVRFRVHEPSTGTEINSLQPGSRTRTGMLYLLIWRGQRIGFSVSFDNDYEYTPNAEREPQTMAITGFGTPKMHPLNWYPLGLDYVPPTFASETEREEAYMKAVEGLLACGVHDDGLVRPGHYLVRVDSGPHAGIYDLRSFGYPA